MRILFTYLKNYKFHLIVGPICKLLEAVFELIVPLVMANIIDVGISNKDTNYIIKMGGLMVLLGAVGLCTTLVCQKCASIASQGFGTKLRNAFYNHINKLSFVELDKIGTPSLITRMTNDINQLQLAVAMLIRLVIRAPFLVVGAMIMAFSINPTLSIIFVIASILIATILYLVMSKSVPYFNRIQKRLDKISLITSENLSGNRVIRAFGKQKEDEKRFNDVNEDLTKQYIRVGRLSALLNPATFLVTNLAIVFIVWFGASFVDAGDMLSGEIIALVNYMTQILLALIVVANLVVIFTKAYASGIRVSEVLNTKSSIEQGNLDKTTSKEGTPKIEFKNVNFSYGGDNALTDISFKIMDGETIGIIGTTGSGKSTIVNLIPRFYDVTNGEVLYNGVNVKELQFNYLRNECGIVPQNAVLFSGKISDNIRYGKKDATKEEIVEALKTAQAIDFVNTLPLKEETLLVQGGKNLSGGQKQRLTIARAVVMKPEVLILDDSASALDYATDLALRTSIKKDIKDTTVIIVSQRVATIRNADKIAVLENGCLKGFDTHNNLVKNCKAYKEICLSQLSKEEVQN